MGGSTTSTTQGSQQSTTQIPQWMSDAGEQNYAFAQQVANQPLQQYQGQMVADTGPQTQQAWDLAASSGNVGQGAFQGGQAGFMGALAQQPQSVTAGQLSNTDLQPYMNPFTQSVINTSLPIMQQNLALSQNQQANAANSANAFGGSRQGVQAGVTQAQGALGMGQMAANLNAQNFAQAQAGATGDINRNLQAAQGNQSAAQAKINSDIQASQGLTASGDAQQKANAANFAMLTSAGAQQQQQAQNQINSQIAKFAQAWGYPQSQLGTLEGALGMTPHDTATSGTSSSTTETSSSPNFASLALGGLQTLGNLFPPAAVAQSDKKVKKNIVALGPDPITGVPIKSFNFKGQAPGSPKTIGPLAQDVEKAAPGSTARIGGVLSVPRETLAAATPSVAHLPQHASNSIASFLPPSTTGSPGLPPSSPGVATGIKAMSAFLPPAGRNKALASVRAGARGTPGALANTKRSPRVMGALG